MAQSNHGVTVAEPEYAGEVVFVKEGDKALELETQTIKVKAQGNAALYITGIGAVTTRYEVDGRESPVQIKATESDTLRFICSTKDNRENPRDYLASFKFQQSRKRRFAEVAKASTFGGVEDKGNQSLPYRATKYGEHSYLVEMWGLQPGEYGFNMASNPKRAFCFQLVNE